MTSSIKIRVQCPRIIDFGSRVDNNGKVFRKGTTTIAKGLAVDQSLERLIWAGDEGVESGLLGDASGWGRSSSACFSSYSPVLGFLWRKMEWTLLGKILDSEAARWGSILGLFVSKTWTYSQLVGVTPGISTNLCGVECIHTIHMQSFLPTARSVASPIQGVVALMSGTVS